MSLGSAAPGSYNATGGEMRSGETADIGTFEWAAQAPQMKSGTVFGMFAIAAGSAQRTLEFDWEFVGADTRHVQVTVHMENSAGQHIRNLERTMVDLGFDAAAGVHDYDIRVTGKSAVFLVDDAPVASFDASDMPGGVWYSGNLRSVVNLWAGDSRYNTWTGAYSPLASPIKARIVDADVRDGDLSGQPTPPDPDGANTVLGTAGDDVLGGTGGDDVIKGGLGDDRLSLDAGDDFVGGGAGNDWLVASGGADITVNLANRDTPQDTGLGADTIRNIEHVQGGSGADTISGSFAANILRGGDGADTLRGQSGADTLVGGLGRDLLAGGADDARDAFVFNAVADSAPGATQRDVIADFARGVDEIDLRGLDANLDLDGNQAFAWSGTGAEAHGLWTVDSGADVLLRGDVDGDGQADFEIQVNDLAALGANDLLL
ncbi:putative protease [Rubellimicrobium mesophilum DSM 19309]|uniref:Putative protease n=1 Tax=Rubellimicrobium mesophilum DSM 19309 TaxID=442562 RepID=A0A017HUK7_9RHOB|nr:putative protease [Rubellimicrobium mesophilum DSM 19309]